MREATAVLEVPETPAAQKWGSSLWSAAWRRLLKRPAAIVSMLYLLMMLLTAIFADRLAPFPYDSQNYDSIGLGPLSPGHWLGTDLLGRDVLSRMIYGTRVSMAVALVVLTVALLVGVTMGALAGYYGGWIDMVISRMTDIMFAFPELLLAILIMGIRGAGIANLFIALGIVSWPPVARLVRGQVTALRDSEFVQAARSLGGSDLRIIARHLVPNLLSPVLVSLSLSMAGVILSEASLSFLGIGVKPPYPSWGSMINDMITLIYTHPSMLLGPSLILALTVLACNFLGDGLRDALDPRLKD